MSVAFDARCQDVPRELFLVEDEPRSRIALAGRLKRRGYEVIEAPTGDSAIRQANEGTVGVVLMDIRLDGEFDGIEVASLIQERHPLTSFIFVSSWAQEPMYHERVREAGIRVGGWIDKPVDVQELSNKIEREQQRLAVLARLSNARQRGLEPLSYLQALIDQGLRDDVVQDVVAELDLASPATIPSEEESSHALTTRIDAIFDQMQHLVEERPNDPDLPALLQPLEEQLEALEEKEAQWIQRNYRAHFEFNPEEGRSLMEDIERVLGWK